MDHRTASLPPWRSRLLIALSLSIASALPNLAIAAEQRLPPTVKVQALMNGKAMLKVGDAPGRMVRVGESEQGVKLLEANTEAAVVLINGSKKRLSLNVSTLVQPSVVSSLIVRPYIPEVSESTAPKGQLTVTSDASGHFQLPGSVNGKPVRFLVDTGATNVVLTEAQATAAGYKLDDGRPVNSLTANGTALSYLINVPSLKVGPFQFANVKALIAPSFEGPEALLGSNVLHQLKMQQQGNQLILTALPATKKPAVDEASSP